MRRLKQDDEVGTVAAGAEPEPTAGPSESGGLIDSADVPQPADVSAATDAPAERDPERRQLIELLMYAWDRARSRGVWERLTEGLAAVGVTVLRPDGEPFDPNAHEVGGVEPTDDDALIDTVAETEVAGFADRGTVIREPVVVVYRRQSS
ncbi:MAG: nucleotide exchange factor GrpE [Nakamurella sp.]